MPIAILPGPGLVASATSRALGEAMGTGWTVAGTAGMYVADGILCVEAARAGIPALTFEIGEGGRLEEECVATGARCVLNGMRHLGMLDSPAEMPARSHVMHAFLGLRANRGGLLTTLPALGGAVRKGRRPTLGCSTVISTAGVSPGVAAASSNSGKPFSRKK